MATVVIRPLTLADRSAWEPLWAGYLAFYQAQIPAAITELTWQRFHDPQIPMHARGAFWDDRLVGIVQYLFHYSAWTSGPYCYLQDLFTVPDARGHGVGRALIEAVSAAALEAGASRVYWLTKETNTQARALYDQVATRSGFIQYRKLFGERPA
jgi:GNAT superfamily N-acetyltransferase